MAKEYSFDELKDITRQLLKTDLSIPDNLISLLGMSNEIYPHDKVLSKKIAQKVRGIALRLCTTDIEHIRIEIKVLLCQ